MKGSISITYIKNGEEKKVNFLKYEQVKKELFAEGYELDFNKLLMIFDKKKTKEIGFNNDIEYVHIKNATFTGANIFNNENNNIIIILEDCIFNCDEINLERGNYQIINPTFRLKSKNTIKVYNCKDFEIVGNNKTNINLLDCKFVNNISLKSINNIEKIKILSDKSSNVKLQNINNIEKYDISSGDIEIEDCAFGFSNIFNNLLYGKCLKLKNSNILSNKLCLLFEHLELENSTIKTKDSKIENSYDYLIIQSFKFPNLEKIKMINSSIVSSKSIILPKLKKLELDETSFIKTKEKIKIGEYNYKNELQPNKPFILSKGILQNKYFMRKYLINNLKELNKKYQQEIEKSVVKLEKHCEEQLENEKKQTLERLEHKSKKMRIRVKEYQRQFMNETKVSQFTN